MNVFLPMMFRTKMTIGANSPFPSFTFPIFGEDRAGLASLMRDGADAAASIARSSQGANDLAQLPWKVEERETAMNYETGLVTRVLKRGCKLCYSKHKS